MSSWSAQRRREADAERAAPPARGALGQGRPARRRRPRRRLSCRRTWSRARASSLAAVAIVVGHGRRVARRPHRLGRPHQPRPVRHRRRRRGGRRQPRRSTDVDLFVALIAAGAGRRARRRSSSGCRRCASGACSSPSRRWRSPSPSTATSSTPTRRRPDLVPHRRPRPILWERFDLDGELRAVPRVRRVPRPRRSLAAIGVRGARSGRVVIATRDNERAADAAAVPTTRVKLSAFLLAGVIAGLAGGLYVRDPPRRRPEQLVRPATARSTVFSTAVIGGLGSVAGAVIGVLAVPVARDHGRRSASCRLVVTGVGLLVVLYVAARRARAAAVQRARPLPALGRRPARHPRAEPRRRQARSTTSDDEVERQAPDGGGAARRARSSDDGRRGRGPGRRRPATRSAADDGDAACCSCRGVDVAYGPVQILFGVDFDVARGRDRRPARHQRRRQVDAAQGASAAS